uniref:phosphatidyl-N-methylethanolamine N-methyltransferase n=1 Tax=Hemiselmis tepida TaxID=464990 RepID=A0A7S0Z2X0_9CRYP|mmetsp:Transcript_5196/g.13161  ORF Transcript_5196/g.13161 Transcript_5196/m.13161 type:complete len:680 (+) Transcript_5196:1-2040(+)|eukprot:CAMPEP_0174932498 /NCGR_PEP_ID=MMETSP1355-20121228/35729_1 /TAXON_ID=464990 /ORGANISM="Hemiselmis tepida, Strain CCMP443" /LENGTH=679 /DNA_ID=CAMNT_0016178913 /DNA_START=1 /DNA_END=2040 /DNA_ORIENTATION=-
MQSKRLVWALALMLCIVGTAGFFWGKKAPAAPKLTPAEAHFTALGDKFKSFHKDPVNIALHFVTTPLALVAAVSMVNKASRSSVLTMLATVAYSISLTDKGIPPQNVVASTVMMGVIGVLAQKTQALSWGVHAALFLTGYLGQELAHHATGEATMQSSYQGDETFLSQLAEHTYYLVPLVFDAVMPGHMDRASGIEARSFMTDWVVRVYHLLPFMAVLVANFVSKDGAMCFPWQFQRSRVLMCKLTSREDVANLDLIRSWTMRQGPSKTTSSHWWHTAPSPQTPPSQVLPAEQRKAFDQIAKCKTITDMFHSAFASSWTLDVLNGMNEVYVSSPTTVKKTSDEVFYTKHIDGPYYYVPFASCFRMIIGMDANEEITTVFDMVPTEQAAQKGDVLAFDFHRECHYIRKNEGKSNSDFRIVLKVHYCVYPKWALPFGLLLGWLSTRYNKAFRALFLFTINPKTPFEHFSAWNVVFWTKVVYAAEAYFGYNNALYISLLALLGWRFNYLIFLVGTSFVHYLRYINTYYHRDNVAYTVFKRDVLIFKSLAVAQLCYHYAHALTAGFTAAPGELDTVGLAMIAGGYALSVYTTHQLGVDGTYFGIELGFVKKQKHFVQSFPYGVIPHPMILSQVVALLGFHKLAAFRAAWPYLVPAHVCLYLIHMVQEHFDVHAGAQPLKKKVA